MLEFSIITISTFVTVLVSTTRYIAKACFNKDISRTLPIFAIIYGVALAVAGYYIPDVEMGKNVIEAVFIGLSTGAAATGFNQVGKQLYKTNATTNDEDLTQVRTEMDIDVPVPDEPTNEE